MKTIVRLRIIFALLCLAMLASPISRVSALAAVTEDSQVCNRVEPQGLTNDEVWHWRAYQNLSCLISMLEQAQNRPATISKDQIALSREEMEHLRQLAWWGRDAAQRIGR